MRTWFRLYQPGDVWYLPLLAALSIVAWVLILRDVLPLGREPWIPAVAKIGTPETVLVFIGSSSCAGSSDPRLAKALRAIRSGLRADAAHRAHTFSSIGISLDWKPEVGTRYLEPLGPFDEVMAGRSWMNSGALKYVWGDDLGGRAAIPQIVVLERVLEEPGDNYRRTANERVRYRKIGADAIIRWSQLAF